MRQSPDAVLTPDLARQIAIRDGGIKAVLAGRIEKADPKYLLTLRVLDPASGAAVAVFEKTLRTGELPAAARSMSDEIRRKLGEPTLQIAKSAALEKATTPSLPCFVRTARVCEP